MNIAVVGLGSMGKRRIRLIQKISPEHRIAGIDSREDRRQEVNQQFGIPCFESLSAAGDGVDCVFVCTSPLSHNSIIREALTRNCHVFTELNLVSDGYEENMKLAEERKRTLFLSSTFLYREEIRYIRERICAEKKWNYIYHIGQYLPDWHPWESYKDFFLGDKRTNGCREILAIELPWLTETFGDVVTCDVLSDKMTALHIDYRDNFLIQFTHKNGNKGCLAVDVVSPCAVRKLEVYSENAYLSWNGTPDSLQEYRPDTGTLDPVVLPGKTEHADGYRAFIVENAYENEILAFFDAVENGRKPDYGFVQDRRVLQIIDSIGA